MVTKTVAVVSLFLLLSNCDDQRDIGTERSVRIFLPTEPVLVCEAYVDAFVSMCVRCGVDIRWAQNRARYNVGGDCADVLVVRDVHAMYGECIPWLDSLTPELLNQGALLAPPYACLEQFHLPEPDPPGS
jgi:hypothetical protein